MADESSSSAGHRFSEDLRRIREDRNVSLDEIHDETRIARTLIESFEEGELYDHPTYNRVYLRSFVKAYAEAVDISREVALEGLDDALEGIYDRELANRYLASPSGSSVSPPVEEDEDSSSADEETEAPSDPSKGPERDLSSVSAPTAGGPEGRGGIVGPPRAVGESPDDETSSSPDQTTDESEKEDSPQSIPQDDNSEEEPSSSESGTSSPVEDQNEDLRKREIDEDESSAGAPSWIEEEANGANDGETQPDPAASPTGESEDMESIGGTGIVGQPTELGSDDSPSGAEGAAESAAPATPGSPPPTDQNGSTADRRIYVTGIGIAVVLFVLAGLGIAYFTTGTTADSTAQSSPESLDTTEAVAEQDTTVAKDPAPPPANITLGETIHLTVLATENVSRILIERDQDLRRPYWIENGEAGVFPFQEEVSLENELSDIRLFIEGYPYPVEPADTVGGLELTRGQLESFVDTLRGEATTLSVSPDTIPVGEPSTQPE
jgi:transcriptional regulator with XRE-family HTH domain